VKRDAAAALESFRAARSLRPEDPSAALNVAIAAHVSGEHAAAIDAASDAMEADATRAAALYVIGCAHLRKEHWSEAEAALSGAAAAAPDEPAVFYQLGWARFLAGDQTGAAAAYGEAVALDTPRRTTC
jgi:Flp pilus assembly protein TadD